MDLALITLDPGLSDLIGLDVARGLRALSKAPILMITAWAEPGEEIDGMAAGADAYLAKPVRPTCQVHDSSTLVLALTYAGALGIALLMFLGQLAAFTAPLASAASAKLLILAARASGDGAGCPRRGPQAHHAGAFPPLSAAAFPGNRRLSVFGPGWTLHGSPHPGLTGECITGSGGLTCWRAPSDPKGAILGRPCSTSR